MPFDSLPTTSPVIEALRQARARIERGWCQNSLIDPAGAVCTIGALHVFVSEDPIRTGRAIELVCRAFGDPGDIVGWNDSPERTQADVLNLYDRAIDLAVAEAINAGH